MKCNQVQELLPLYVGGDLEAKSATTIIAHLGNCTECGISAAEYLESYQLIQSFTPPRFDEQVYEGIRQGVLREIAKGPAQTKTGAFKQLLPNPLRFNPSLAFATLLLLTISIFALYFVATRENKPEEVVNNPPPLSLPKASTQPMPESQASAIPSVPPQESQRKSPGAGNVVAKRKTLQLRNQRAIDSPDFGQGPNGSIEVSSVSNPAPDAAVKPLRVEIQTNDQNIRIIWFSYQNTKQDSPAKSFKGI